MQMAYNASSENCYPNTAVLINKLNIKDEKLLQEAEKLLVTKRIMELQGSLSFINVDFQFYLGLHGYIFRDIYDWAGKIRNVNISKKGTSFCPADDIYSVGNAVFKRLNDKKLYKDLSFEQMIDEATEMFDTLNLLHPFRDGNGRTERLFFSGLMKNIGYEIDFEKCDRDLLMISTIYSAQGNKSLLRAFFESNIVKCDYISKLNDVEQAAEKIEAAFENGKIDLDRNKRFVGGNVR